MKPDEVRFVRMERNVAVVAGCTVQAINSWITVKLPKPMVWGEVEALLEKSMPGWEMVSACAFDPDER